MKKIRRIEIITRAVILHRARILLCRAKGADWYFLPGGHVEFGETLERALARELKEELGIQAKIGPLLGSIENIYTKHGIRRHEINFVFRVVIPKTQNLKSQEDHIEFLWHDIPSLAAVHLLPLRLAKAIARWHKV
ncbi:MAG: NUDIX domain-containing protein [Candidatus Sungbacteria bacterium]|uniref:NUDIX domain-containing protein n=1 Tax=Candidatus Sungiibacteriota bacterium TaxID=2750080 RepID=A0A932R1N7_9BACT|nr:NUDIX domain-containing protein [Candidatus Sungbacteria bacterium]